MLSLAAIPRPSAPPLDPRRLWHRFWSRLREPPFWVIQGILFSVTALHYGLEAAGSAGSISTIHHIPVILYLVPVTYAGILYGFEGGVMTALWVLVLTTPSVMLTHRRALIWLGEVAQLAATLGVGAIVAWRVELESNHRRRAEATSRRLALLHDVASAATQTVKLERTLNDVVAKVAEALESDAAWVAAWDSPEQEIVFVAWCCLARTAESTPDSGVWPDWHHIAREVRATGQPTVLEGRGAGVPLVADGMLLGVLGVSVGEGRALTADDRELLDAMADSIAVAMNNARLYREELHLRESLREYAAQVTRAHEEERARIARELHDEAIQNLVLLCRQLDQTLQARAERSGECRRCADRLAHARAIAKSTLQGIRDFSRDLRPSILDDLGLIAAIEWLVADLRKRTGISATLNVSGQPRRLSPDGEILLFRIVQEALRNVEKHAAASTVVVSVSCQREDMVISVRDDGRGFRTYSVRNGVQRGHLGLLGMQERANLLGASFEVTSRPGAGTEVVVRLPLSALRESV